MTGRPETALLERHNDRQLGMFTDAALHGDLLIVGLALARLVDLGAGETFKMCDLARLAFPCPPHWHGPAWQARALRRTRALLAGDIPRYEPTPASGRCSAPVTGRDQLCDAAGTGGGATLVHVPTGEWSYLQSCTEHRAWLEGEIRTNMLDVRAAGYIPDPTFNTGGIMARHLPEVPWTTLWDSLRPNPAPGTSPATDARPATWSEPAAELPVEGPDLTLVHTARDIDQSDRDADLAAVTPLRPTGRHLQLV